MVIFVCLQSVTRKHSSRMRTAWLPTICTLATRCEYWWGCPQVNKFEQVSSDGHWMSLAGVWDQGAAGVPCLMV